MRICVSIDLYRPIFGADFDFETKTTLQVAFESDLLFGGKTYSGK